MISNNAQEATINNMSTINDQEQRANLLYIKGYITLTQLKEYRASPSNNDHFQEEATNEYQYDDQDEYGPETDTISQHSTYKRTRASKSKDMSLCMQNGQNIKVVMERGTITKYGNYRSDTNTIQDIETGTHYYSPSAFAQAQYLKIGKNVSVNGWDKIQCFTNDEWVCMNTLRT